MKKVLYIAIAIVILAGACALLVACEPKTNELAVPTGVELGGDDVLRWNAVEGAESYTVVVDEEEYGTATNSLDMFEILSRYTTYEIKVAANSSAQGVISSDWSEELTVTQEMPAWLTLGETKDGSGWAVGCADPSKIKGKLIIPDYYQGKPIVEIMLSNGYRNNFWHTAVTGVILPDTVKYVGAQAFYACRQLTRVRWPRFLEEIGLSAFCGTALERVELPYGVKKIRENAFADARLKSVSLPSTLEPMTYPNEAVETNPFYGNPYLSSIEIDEGNKVYKSDGNCIIRIADNMLAVGCCTGVVPSYVERIGRDAFREMDLESVTLPEGLVSIGAFAFYRNGRLTELKLPQSLESIGSDAFLECVGLESVYFGASLESIGDGAFGVCVNLESITVSSDNERFFSEGNCLISRADNTLVLGCFASEIPSCVERIGDYAFSGQTRLESIVFPKSVTVIGKGAFSCTGLKALRLPSGLKEIGNYAFQNCMELVHVALPGSVERVGSNAFGNMQEISNGNFTIQIPSPMTVIVPDNVVSIGVKAFYSTRTTIYTSYAERPEGWYQSLDGIDKWNGKNFVFWGCELAFDQDNLPYLVSVPVDNYLISKELSPLSISKFIPERSGYAFAGWATERNGEVVYPPNRVEFEFKPILNLPELYEVAVSLWKLIWREKTYNMLEFLSDQQRESAYLNGVERLYPIWEKLN